MKISRILLISTALVGGFLYVTSRTDWGRRAIFRPLVQAGKAWLDPDVAKTAGLSPDETNNIDIYKAANLGTVNITSTVYRQTIFMEVYGQKDSGSGFIVSADGRILTNSHVIGDPKRVEVRLSDQSRYPGQVLYQDPYNDMAIIKIEPKKKLTVLRLGDSDGLQVGQKVLAIGNPFGLDGSLTTGIVSSLGRTIRGENNEELEGMIQTDAAINPGNSGGPLLDSAGNVIGINTAIIGPAGGNVGIGFALPINRAKTMLADFQTGRQRPKIGITTVAVAGDLAAALDLPEQGGLLVQEVAPGSPAAKAGVRAGRQTVQVGNEQIQVGGDLIVSIDGHPVERTDALIRALAHKRAGDAMELTVYRGGRTVNLRVQFVDGEKL